MASSSLSFLSRTLDNPVQLYDETDGLFGELIHPQLVLNSRTDNVGKIDDPSHALDTIALFSQSNVQSSQEGVPVEFENMSNVPIRVRWIDTNGHTVPSHVWTVEASSTLVQYATPGHLFLMTTTNESVLGAYRPIRPLPSGLAHCVVIAQEEGGFVLETMLLDETKQDALVVAAAALDSCHCHKTVLDLHKIVSNITQDPNEPKFHKLRMTNPKIQRDIVNSQGAMDMLHALGFRQQSITDDTNKEDDYLILAEPVIIERFHLAQPLLDLLMTRTAPHFVSELAPPTPWQKPTLASGNSRWRTGGTHFLTDDEKWARTERRRRGGSARKPEPGQAPSSRGNWGR